MDPYVLYEAAVQDAPHEAGFLAKLYRRETGREARRLREDFCGSFWLGYEWVRLHPKNESLGIDLDFKALRSGFLRHGGKGRERAYSFHGDVLNPPTFASDIVFAGNFSYNCFKRREDLLAYFKRARQSLGKRGLFVLDHFGGADIHTPTREQSVRRDERLGRVEVSWEQLSFDEFTHEGRFRLRTRTSSQAAWRTLWIYDWRLWTLPELRDLLVEAGFRAPKIYWQADDGRFRPRARSEAGCLKWLAYIVARPA